MMLEKIIIKFMKDDLARYGIFGYKPPSIRR